MNTETVTYRNHTITIGVDDLVENPREWDNFGTLALKNSGWADKDIMDTEEFFSLLLNDEEFRPYDREIQDYDYYSVDAEKAWRNIERKYVVLPVYKYEHGRVCYNTTGFSCPWDSGQNGYIYVSKADIRKEYGVKRITKKLEQQVIKRLDSEVETFSQAVSGGVYGFSIEETGDSCGDFYGHDHEESGLLEHARNSIDCSIDYAKKSCFDKLKTFIRNRVPLEKRVGLNNLVTA